MTNTFAKKILAATLTIATLSSGQTLTATAIVGTAGLASVLSAAPAEAGFAVKGHNVGMVRFDGGSFEQRGKVWIETGAHGQERFRFAETHRDEWSVYLYDKSRDLSLSLDLHRKQIMYKGAPLYRITAADHARPVHTPKTYTAKAGPIWNQNDANHKCPSVAARYNAQWTGQWWTTVPGKMSVCQITM